MIHKILPVGMLACNCHIVGDETSGEALVIDPGDEVERIQQVLASHKLKVKLIVATHAHIDHVGGLAELQKFTGAPVLMHQEDMPLYQNLAMQAAWVGMEAPAVIEVSGFLRDGDALRWGAFNAEVIATPGHSPGSLSLYMPGDDGRLFSGDTLFQGSIGRTDLWGGDFRQIINSIRQRLLALPDATPVFPGHGPATTIGVERESNPFLLQP